MKEAHPEEQSPKICCFIPVTKFILTNYSLHLKWSKMSKERENLKKQKKQPEFK